MQIKGVDISVHNGDVNFSELKKAGIEFVIIRCGYGQDRTKQDDKEFKRNVEKCVMNGMPYGVYLYSYANSVEKAKSEAAHVLRLIDGTKPAYGVWYDVEDPIHSHDKKLLTDCVVAFCEIIEKAGYYCGVYSSLSWFNTRFDSRIDKYDKWVAQWSKECTYQKPFGMWQFTDKLKIGGRTFDGNYAYKDYPKIIGINITSETTKKSVDEIAVEVLNGVWGNGSERKRKITQAGYDYTAIQKRVNEYHDIAKACLNGDYGNGNARKSKVTKAGFNYKTVQTLVNEMS